MKKTLALALAVFVAGGSPAFAGVVTYTTEASFLAAATPTHFDSFEDEALTSGSSVVTTGLSVAITPVVGGSSTVYIANSLGWASDGTQILSGGGNPWRLAFTLDFPVYGIGFDVMSASEAPTQGGQQSVVRFDLPTGEQFVMSSCPPCLNSPGYPGNADYFFGVLSNTPFSTFSILNTAYSDGVGFDRMYLVAAPVPLPGAAWLFAAALGGLASIRRLPLGGKSNQRVMIDQRPVGSLGTARQS